MLTQNLKLPLISTTQASPAITHNEALRRLDAMVQTSVRSTAHGAPPENAAEGDNFIVDGAGTGAWAGQGGRIAALQDGAWEFIEARTGWLVWVDDENLLHIFDGAAWRVFPGEPDMLGVNAAADATNRLSVSSEASLFADAGTSHRLKIKKAVPADTASVIYQTGFSGRAEIGLTGDDDFHFKVSANGSSWTEGLRLRASDGKVSFPAGLAAPLAVAQGGTGAANALTALSGLGLRHTTGAIADDALAVMDLGGDVHNAMVMAIASGSGLPLGLIFVRLAPTPAIVPIAMNAAAAGYYDSSLSGTTGTDGQVNFAALPGGRFQIENRRGFAVSYTLYVFR